MTVTRGNDTRLPEERSVSVKHHAAEKGRDQTFATLAAGGDRCRGALPLIVRRASRWGPRGIPPNPPSAHVLSAAAGSSTHTLGAASAASRTGASERARVRPQHARRSAGVSGRLHRTDLMPRCRPATAPPRPPGSGDTLRTHLTGRSRPARPSPVHPTADALAAPPQPRSSRPDAARRNGLPR